MQLSKALIKHIRSLQQKKFRDLSGQFFAEGSKCVDDLSKGFELVYRFEEGVNATKIEIEQISALRAPQGVVAVFRQSKPETDFLSQDHCSELILALDGVQDPGNLGTIIRTCDWFGIRHVVCSLDTADCYNPKVVQATMGALARVHVHYTDLPAWLQHQTDTPIYGTLLDGRNMYDDSAIPSRSHGIILMGNEGKGISPAVRPLITHPLFIPSYPPNVPTSESLNVAIATALTLAEFRRPI